MSKGSKIESVPSLAQHFNAPEHFLGQFGVMCGYSADCQFLNDAAERFTRLTSAQRAHRGQIALCVLLDAGNPAISMLDAPSVAHLPLRDVVERPFRLLHAKVALLGFRHAEIHDHWRLRLIISTGNWTRQTIEKSLDLAWTVEVDSEKLSKFDSATVEAAADIQAAYGLLQWLEDYFDTRILDLDALGLPSETKRARQQLHSWVVECSNMARGKSRFFDSRSSSLLSQLPSKITSCSKGVARNYLAMGSGFYESAESPSRIPEVPGMIIKALQEKALLTRNAEVDVFVNPDACQAIAHSVPALKRQGICVRPAIQPQSVFGDTPLRTLHAKFLFGANYRDNSSVCNSAWVYLGSGNLTGPGFAKKMSFSAGNLEAGIVFSPESLHWKEGQGIEHWQVVTTLLPIQWSLKFDENSEPPKAGGDMEPRTPKFTVPPVAWLNWWETADGGELRVPSAVAGDFQVLDTAGVVCPTSASGFQWFEPRPRQVQCRWIADGIDCAGYLPVVDSYGRIAAVQLPAIDIEEAAWQLADFPLPPSCDEDDGDDRGGGSQENGNPSGKHTGSASYPIRQMMELLENIAVKQTEISQLDWSLWCQRLEQTLGQVKTSPVVAAFQSLDLNPLSPLRQVVFRPTYAETSDSEAGRIYEDTLNRIEVMWSVDHLGGIGVSQ